MPVEEIFVEIPGFPNYSVSNYGCVLNTKTGRELKPWSHKGENNKFIVKLWDNGDCQNFFVHRLVAQAFFVDFDEQVDVYHINDNRHDNGVANLHLVYTQH